MFELEYLYEQLKTNTLNSMLVESLNTITESCYDTLEFDQLISETMNSIEESARNGRLNIFQKLKTNVATAEKILDQHKDAALKCKPIGLQYKDFKTFMSDDQINSVYKKSLAYLNKFNASKATEAQCKEFIMDSQNNVQYREVSKIFGDGQENWSVNKIIVSKTEDKELTKNDIASAVKFLQEYDKVINKLRNDAMKNSEEYTQFVRNGGMASLNTKGEIGKLRKNAANHQKSLINIADSTYYAMMNAKLTQQFNQAKRIVVKAANYNPRNLKESAVVQFYIDAMYDFNEC